MREKGKGIDYPLYWDDIDRRTDRKHYPCQEYDNGPWASTGAGSSVSTTGYWHFPSPDVSNKDEVKPPIRIVSLKQGFVVSLSDFEDNDLAFTDAFDLADWLLEWLGFEEEIVETAHDILAGLGDVDELIDRADREAVVGVARSAHGIRKDQGEVLDEARSVGISDIEWQDKMEADQQDLLDVAEAAQAYVEAEGGVTVWAKLVEAVKKWRGIDRGEGNNDQGT